MTKDLKFLLIDNYDSFTFNLKHLIESQKNIQLRVVRNDDDFLPDVKNCKYDAIIIGPGPGSPINEKYFGSNKKVILDYGTKALPILGICLGLQGIYDAFGGNLKISSKPMHGKISELVINEKTPLLSDIPNKSKIMRYHSIVCDTRKIPDCIKVTALSDSSIFSESEVMAIEHKEHPIYGLQFHPESFATEHAEIYINNFVKIVRSFQYKKLD